MIDGEEFSFCVMGKPFGKKNMLHTGRFSFNPKENVEYMSRVQEELFKAFPEITDPDQDGSYMVAIVAYWQIPKSISRKKRELMVQGIEVPTVKPDVDNISKAILDAITKSCTIWRDDSQVSFQRIYKFYSEIPRVEVFIRKATSIDKQAEFNTRPRIKNGRGI